MNPVAILETYEQLTDEEAFEALDCDGVTPDEVEAVLGEFAAADYEFWIYNNLE